MTDPRVEAMVEAAAKALLAKPRLGLYWEEVSEHVRSEFRLEASVALGAAGVPALLARMAAVEKALEHALWAWDARKSADPGHTRRRAAAIKEARAVLEGL